MKIADLPLEWLIGGRIVTNEAQIGSTAVTWCPRHLGPDTLGADWRRSLDSRNGRWFTGCMTDTCAPMIVFEYG